MILILYVNLKLTNILSTKLNIYLQTIFFFSILLLF